MNKINKTKPIPKIFLSKLGHGLLEVLGALGDAAVAVSKVKYKRMYTKSEASYYRSLRELNKKGLIKKQRRRHKSVYVLTQAGYQILKRPRSGERRSDGFATLVVFDIPEERARQRTIFRRYLIRNGYIALRESVYISPNKLSEEIKQLVRELKIDLDVNVFDVRVG